MSFLQNLLDLSGLQAYLSRCTIIKEAERKFVTRTDGVTGTVAWSYASCTLGMVICCWCSLVRRPYTINI